MDQDQIDRLKWLRDQEKWGVLEAARQYGMKESTYKALANGRRRLTLDHADAIAGHHRVSRGWLAFGEGGPEGKATVPILGFVGAGQTVTLNPDGRKPERVEATLGDETAAAFEVKGDSMIPVALDGDIIVVGPERRNLSGMIGKEGIYVLEDGQRFFKILERGDNPERFSLISYNAPSIRNVEIHSVAKLIGIIRKNHQRIIVDHRS